MKFYIDHPIDDNDESKRLHVVLMGDIVSSAKWISSQLPAENVYVWAMGRARMVFNSGVMVADHKSLDKYFVMDLSKANDYLLEHEWTNLIANTDEFDEDAFEASAD